MESHPDPEAARHALESIAKVRDDIADRARAPRGFYAYLSVGAALVMLAMGTRESWRWALVAGGAGIIGSSIMWYRERTRMWDVGDPFTRAAWRYWLMIVPYIAFLLATIVSESLIVGAVGAAVTIVLWSIVGPRWDRDYRQALRGEQ